LALLRLDKPQLLGLTLTRQSKRRKKSSRLLKHAQKLTFWKRIPKIKMRLTKKRRLISMQTISVVKSNLEMFGSDTQHAEINGFLKALTLKLTRKTTSL